MVWKREGEEKHSMSSNCSTIQQKHGRCQLDRHIAIIVSNTRPDKALVPKDSGISFIWQRSMLGSYTVVTFVRMENHIRIINLYSSSVLSYQML